MKEIVRDFIETTYGVEANTMISYIPVLTKHPKDIKVVMINEVVADIPDNDFYSTKEESNYRQTTLALFQKAGVPVTSIQEIEALGIYITNAIKIPKTDTNISRDMITKYVPLLEKELSVFSSLQVVMLMGDVAKKAYNMITKKRTGKNVVPAISTYKLRNTEIYDGIIRVFPSYIMTGKNILIEKSKVTMAADDIKRMINIIQ